MAVQQNFADFVEEKLKGEIIACEDFKDFKERGDFSSGAVKFFHECICSRNGKSTCYMHGYTDAMNYMIERAARQTQQKKSRRKEHKRHDQEFIN